MKAALFSEFRGPIRIVDLPEPTAHPDGVVVRVEATGLCRSDWHGWMGHDPEIALPHVPGHELAGTVVQIGSEVEQWAVGDRVTVPFAAGCGHCDVCRTGNEQVCPNQFQPGFTAWGSFAEYVALRLVVGSQPPIEASLRRDVCAQESGSRFTGAAGLASQRS